MLNPLPGVTELGSSSRSCRILCWRSKRAAFLLPGSNQLQSVLMSRCSLSYLHVPIQSLSLHFSGYKEPHSVHQRGEQHSFIGEVSWEMLVD